MVKKTLDERNIHVHPTIYISYTCKLFLKKKKLERLVDDIFSSNCILLSMCRIIKPLFIAFKLV